MTYNLNQIVVDMAQSGVMDIALPFILVFVIVFSVLQQIRIFNKKSHLVIGIIMGFATIFSHVVGLYPPCWDVVNIINASLPRVALLLIGIVSFFLVAGVFGLQQNMFIRYMVPVGFFLFAIIIYTTLTRDGCGFIPLTGIIENIMGWIVPIAIIGGILYWIWSQHDEDEVY